MRLRCWWHGTTNAEVHAWPMYCGPCIQRGITTEMAPADEEAVRQRDELLARKARGLPMELDEAG